MGKRETRRLSSDCPPRGRDALRSVENLHPGVIGAACVTVTISTSLGSAPGERESSPDSCSTQDTQLCVLDITLVTSIVTTPCLPLSGLHFLA